MSRSDPSSERDPDRQEADLDEAVAETFPASDPIAPQSPAPTPDDGVRPGDEEHRDAVPAFVTRPRDPVPVMPPRPRDRG